MGKVPENGQEAIRKFERKRIINTSNDYLAGYDKKENH